jgi:hypothetical protein
MEHSSPGVPSDIQSARPSRVLMLDANGSQLKFTA